MSEQEYETTSEEDTEMENMLDNLQWAKDFLNQYERKHPERTHYPKKFF